ncbi:MAG: PEGA domain-containing protein [Methanoregula sp.]|nr:PEGA domain-containing protein [Methanoregula sp.]
MSQGTMWILSLACVVCIAGLLVVPAQAFTADTLAITIDTNGNAVADFRFTLEGFIENALPQSMLEAELTKGLTTSADPPQVLSFDRSSATLLVKNFAEKVNVPTGTEYRTTQLDFRKAEIAVKNSALNGIISADFSPKKMVVTFPDGYTREFSDFSGLPALKHTVIDPQKQAASDQPPTGTISIMSSPSHARVSVDGEYTGDTPAAFPGITPGTHTVSLELDGFLPFTKTVNVTAGETVTLNAVLSYIPPSPTKSVPGFGLPVTMIALAVCGMAFSRRFVR